MTRLRKIDELEGLRGIMAWWVVAGHVLQALNVTVPVISRNTLAVDVFIILSGFVISYLMAARPEGYRRYILRRGFRLFPLYLLILILSVSTLGLVAQAIAAMPFGGPHNSVRLELVQAGLARPLPHIALHLLLAQGVVPERVLAHAPYTLIGQAWSISLEWQFYLVAPAIAALCTRSAGRIAFVAAATAVSLAPTLVGEAFLLDRIGYFAVGIASFWLFRAVHDTPWLVKVPLVVAVVALALMAVTGSVTYLPIVIWTVTLAATPSFDPHDRLAPIGRLLLHPLVLGEGRRSYSIYMVHMLFLWAAAGLLIPWINSRLWLGVAIAVATIAATAIAARATYRWIELPGIALGNRIAGARPRARPAAG